MSFKSFKFDKLSANVINKTICGKYLIYAYVTYSKIKHLMASKVHKAERDLNAN